MRCCGRSGWVPAEGRGEDVRSPALGRRDEPFTSGVYVNDLADEGEAGARRAWFVASWPGSPH